MAVKCIDCKYVRQPSMIYMCAAPFNNSPVTGELVLTECLELRNDANKCGPSGFWFQPKQPEVPPMPPREPPIAA